MSNNTIIIDDRAPQVTYSGKWLDEGGNQEFNRTSSSSVTTGDTAAFTFTGTSLSVIANINSGGRCNVSFAVDGIPSNFETPLVNASLHQRLVWSSPTLTDNSHTFVCTILSCVSSGTENKFSLWLEHFLYTPSPSTVLNETTFFIDDRDTRLNYTGNWTLGGGDGDFGLTTHAGSKGASFSFKFVGISISVWGGLSPNSVGNSTLATFALDNYPPIVYTPPPVGPGFQYGNQLYLSTRPLNQSEHTLVATSESDNPLWIDYILVVPGSGTLASLVPTPPSSPPISSTSSTNSPPISSASSTNATASQHVAVGAIAGGAVGGILALCGVLALVFFLWRRKLSSKVQTETKPDVFGRVTAFTAFSPTSAPTSLRGPSVGAVVNPPKGSKRMLPDRKHDTLRQHPLGTATPPYVDVVLDRAMPESEFPITHMDSDVRLPQNEESLPPSYSRT